MFRTRFVSIFRSSIHISTNHPHEHTSYTKTLTEHSQQPTPRNRNRHRTAIFSFTGSLTTLQPPLPSLYPTPLHTQWSIHTDTLRSKPDRSPIQNHASHTRQYSSNIVTLKNVLIWCRREDQYTSSSSWTPYPDSTYTYHPTPIDTHWWLPLQFCISTPEDGHEPCPKHVEC